MGVGESGTRTLVVVTVVMSAGCSSQAPAADPVFESFAAPYLAAAEAANASPEQVSILQDAIANGEMTFEAYSTALDNTFACFEDAGILYSPGSIDESRGFPFRFYSYEGGEEGNPLAEQCILKHFDFVDSVYQMQPSSLEAQDAFFESKMPGMIDCLNEEGYPVANDASIDEVKSALMEMATDDSRIQADPLWIPIRCVIEAGLTTGF